MSRSLRVRADLVPQVELAVKRNGFPRKKDLAEALEMAESTVRNFRKGKPVDHAIFVEICQKLNLEWRDFADLGEITEPHRESEEAVIARYSDSEAEKTISAPPGLAESEEAIAQPLRQSREAVDPSAIALGSERGVDYSRLRDLLAAGKWRDADRETGTIMLKAASKVRQGWLRSDDIKNFPCTDLQIIDSLWRKHSKGRFGFSIQKRIWLNIGGTNDANLQTFHAFADSVGWRLEGFWVARVKHTIDAPEGHLPDLDFGVSPHYVEKFRAAGGFGHDGAWNARRTILSALASKLADCNI
jgi:DNA-binding Xre family transcriptional regulator